MGRRLHARGHRSSGLLFYSTVPLPPALDAVVRAYCHNHSITFATFVRAAIRTSVTANGVAVPDEETVRGTGEPLAAALTVPR